MTDRPRNLPTGAIVALVVLGILLVALGVTYFVDTAAQLPGFLPGHEAGSTRHHTKHGLAAAILAVACFAGAWLGSGSRTARP